MMLANVLNALTAPAEWLIRYVRGWDDEYQNQSLTSQRVLSYAPIWYGVNKISGHIAQLPVCVYKRLDRGAERDRSHAVHRLMRRPNAYQTSIVFREQIATHSLLEGSGRAAIVRDGNRIAELLPLLPDCTLTTMLEGVKVHATRPPKDDRVRRFFTPVPGADKAEGLIMLEDRDVLHIPGLSFDGITGIPLRKIAERNIGASIDSEKRLANQMKSGFSGSLMLQAPAGLLRKEEDAKQFLDEFERRHNAPDKAGKVGLLREGMTANVIAMNNKEAEMIDHRRFQRQDAALWLGLESILGDDTSVSYNSLEQKNLAYLMNCLNKWLKRWEEELEYKLLSRRQWDSDMYYIRFQTAALLKSDYKTSVESLSSAIAATIMSPNEAREKLDMNPYSGGDSYRNPAITPDSGSDATQNESVNGEPIHEPAARLAIDSRLSHMIGVEASKVCYAAQSATQKNQNFVVWVDDFYDKKWQPKLADCMEELGLDRNLATLHCDESKRRILACCDESNQQTLVDNIKMCTSNWKVRACKIGVNDHA